MFASKRVQLHKQLDHRQFLAIDAHRYALLEADFDVDRRIRRALRAAGQLVHRFFRLVPGVLQQTALVAKVEEIAVTAVDVLLGMRNRHVELRCIGQRVLTAANLPFPPGRDHRQLGIEGHRRQFEAYLIVAFACRTMRDSIRAFDLGNIDQMLGDERPRKRGPQQIFPLVDRPGLHGREDEIGQEFFPQIADVKLACAGLNGLLLQAVQFFALPQIRAKTDHLAVIVVIAQPGYNHRCIQAAAVGQHDLIYRLSICHFRFSLT